MAISYVGTSPGGMLSVTGGTSWTTAQWRPSGVVDGDLLLAVIETANQSSVGLSGTGAWTLLQAVTNGGTAGAIGATAMMVYYKRYNSATDNVSLTTSFSGDHESMVVMAFRGVVSSGDPTYSRAAFNTGGSGGTSSSVVATLSSLSQSGNDSGYILGLSYNGTDSNTHNGTWSQTASEIASLTEHYDLQVLTGNGGGLSAAGGKRTSGASMTSSLTYTFATAREGGMLLMELVAAGISVLAGGGDMGAVAGGSLTLSLKLNHTISGALGAVAKGTLSVSQTLNHTISGDLPAVEGSMAVENTDLLTLTMDAALGAIGGSSAIDLLQDLTLDAPIGAVAGALDVSFPQSLTVDGALGAVDGAASVELVLSGVLDGSLGSLEGVVVSTFPLSLLLDSPVSTVEGSIVSNSPKFVQAFAAMSAFMGFAQLSFGDVPCYDRDTDTRELILRRLAEVLESVPGVVSFGRNDPTVPESKLPGVLLLDADEDAYTPTFGRGRPAASPNIVTMNPEVHILVQEDPADVGATLNDLIEAVTDAVLNDEQLQALCHNDEMEYEGMGMSLDLGRQMLGEAQLNFSFRYVLWPLDEPCASYDDVIPEGNTQRERVLDALEQILNQVPGVERVMRNDVTVPESATPAIVLIDGDEDADSGAAGRHHPGYAPNIVRMNPEVYIIAQDRPDIAGPKLNEIRMMVIRYITHDPVLRSLLYQEDLRYEGCQTALALGRALTGEMGMVISMARKRD